MLAELGTLSTALLLNEVFRKKVAKFETKFPKFSPKFAPKFAPKCFVLCWQVEKSSPKFHQIFPIGNFKFQIEFQIQFHQKFHKHTSAGLAALRNPLAIFRGLSGQESGKSLEKVRRVWKKSRKGPERLLRDFFQPFLVVVVDFPWYIF